MLYRGHYKNNLTSRKQHCRCDECVQKMMKSDKALHSSLEIEMCEESHGKIENEMGGHDVDVTRMDGVTGEMESFGTDQQVDEFLVKEEQLELGVIDVTDPESVLKYNDEDMYKKQLEKFLEEDKDELLSCDKCNFKTYNKRKLKRHAKVSHSISPKDNVCPRCDKHFTTKEKLDAHIREIHIQLHLSCSQCNFEALKKRDLMRHVRNSHGTNLQHDSANGASIKCNLCDQVFMNNRNLQRHVRVLHKKILPFICDKCEYKAGEERQLTRHMKRVHDGIFESEARPILKCPKCDYTTNWGKSKITNHIKTVHDKIKDFKCPSCDFCCSQRGNLRLHIEQVHNKIRRFSCLVEGCKYKSNFKNDITKHNKTVHGTVKDISCHLCTYQTAVQGYLTVHMKNVHGLKKDYLCPHCGRQFHVFRNFHKHIKVIHPFQPLPVRKKDPTQTVRRVRSMFNKQSSVQPLKDEPSPIKSNFRTKSNQNRSDHTDNFSGWKEKQQMSYKLEQPEKRVVNGKTYQQCKCPEPDCNYTTLWGKNHLRKHIKAVHQKVKDVTCDQCEYTACQNVHMSTHLKLIHLTCYQCYARFWDNLKDMAQCSSCDVKFPLRRHLVRHVKAVHPDEPLPCKAISVEGRTIRIANEKEFESEFGTAEENREKTKCYNLELERLKTHIKKTHPVVQRDPNISDSCPECSYKTQDKSRLRAHIREVHRQIKDFLCELCSYTTSKKSNLASHILRQHEGVKIPRKKRLGADGKPLEHGHKVMTCSYCKERCDGRSKFEEHITAMHPEVKRLCCPHCIFTAKKVYALNRHIKAVHYKIKDQNCSECSFTTTDKSTLTKHIKAIHLGMKGVNHKNKKSKTQVKNKEKNNTTTVAGGEDTTVFVTPTKDSKPAEEFIQHQMSVANPPYIQTQLQLNTGISSLTNFQTQIITVDTPNLSHFIAQTQGNLISAPIKSKQIINEQVSQPPVNMFNPQTISKPYQPRKKEEPIIDPNIPIAPEIIEFEQQERKAFSCPQCRYQSDTEEELTGHFKKEHEKIKNLPCHLCNYVTWNKYNLRRHIQNVHTEKSDKLNIPLIEMNCSQCSYQFSIRDIHSRAQSRLNRHSQEVHGTVKDISCSLCNYQTKRKSNLEAHMQRIHAKKKDENKEKDVEKPMPPLINIMPSIPQKEIDSSKKWTESAFVSQQTTYFMPDRY